MLGLSQTAAPKGLEGWEQERQRRQAAQSSRAATELQAFGRKLSVL
jgi:hypothetical protein